MQFFKVIALLLLSGTMVSCASYQYDSNNVLEVTSTAPLPKVLSESSGLLCNRSSLVSINDSGNQAALFSVNYQGHLLSQSLLPLSNIDWEALAQDDSAIFIADVGNNKGLRNSVQVHRVEKDNPSQIFTMNIQYQDNNPSSNMAYRHDYDSEAMVHANDTLILFSKSWRTKIARVYEVNTALAMQTLTPINYIEGLPGVITGADYDHINDLYVIVGYLSDPFGNFDTFLAQVSLSFDVLDVWPLHGFKQVEGVCVDKDGTYWFTQEAIDTQIATMSSAKITSVSENTN